MKYRAKLVKNGVLQTVVVDAVNLETATDLLSSRGHLISKVQPVNWQQASASRQSFLQFAEELLILLRGGLSLVECFDVMQRGTRGVSSMYASTLHLRLREGASLSSAMNTVRFPPLFVALVQASEQTGDTTLAIERYVKHERRVVELRRKTSSAVSYPLIILVVGICVIGFLLLYVVPRFSLVFEDFGGRLSWTAQLMVWWSRMIDGHVMAVLSALIACVVAQAFIVMNPKTRRVLWACLHRIPFVSRLLLAFQLANLTRTLGVLCDGGIPLTRGLRIAAELASPDDVKERIDAVASSVLAGQNFSRALGSNGFDDEVLIRLIAVGERSGDLAGALFRIADLYGCGRSPA